MADDKYYSLLGSEYKFGLDQTPQEDETEKDNKKHQDVPVGDVGRYHVTRDGQVAKEGFNQSYLEETDTDWSFRTKEKLAQQAEQDQVQSVADELGGEQGEYFKAVYAQIKAEGQIAKAKKLKESGVYSRKDANEIIDREEQKVIEAQTAIDNNPFYVNLLKEKSAIYDGQLANIDYLTKEVAKKYGVQKSTFVDPESMMTSVPSYGVEGDLKMSQLQAARNFTSQAKDITSAPLRYAKADNAFDDFLYNAVSVGKGVADILSDPTFWNINMTQQDNVALLSALKKIEKATGRADNLSKRVSNGDFSEILSEEEEAMLSAYVELQSARAERANNTARLYNVGKGAVQTAEFMLEMAITAPFGKAISSSTTKAVGKYLLNRTTKMATDTFLKNAAKWGATKGARLIAGQSGNLLSSAARLPFFWTTGDAISERALTVDNNGKLVSGIDAYVGGALGSYKDIVTEGMGSATMEAIGSALKVTGVDNILKAASKTKPGQFAKKVYNGVSNSTVAKMTGFDGLGEEFLEEMDAAIIERLSGEKDALKDFFKTDNLLITIGTIVPMSAIGGTVNVAQRTHAKNKMEKAAKTLSDLMLKAGYKEEQVAYFLDVTRDTTPKQMSAILSPIVNEVSNKASGAHEAVAPKATIDGLDMYKAVKDYTIASIRFNTLDGTYQAQEAQQREAKKAELEAKYGQFYRIPTSVNEKTGETMESSPIVETATLNDGRQVFINSQSNEDGMMTATDMEGNHIFIKESDIFEELNEDGVAVKQRTEESLDAYLSRQIMERRQSEEATRMQQEKTKQVQALAGQFVPGTTVDVGTKESPVNAVVYKQTDTGVDVEDAEGNARAITYEELGEMIGAPVHAKSDDELTNEQVALLEKNDRLYAKMLEFKKKFGQFWQRGEIDADGNISPAYVTIYDTPNGPIAYLAQGENSTEFVGINQQGEVTTVTMSNISGKQVVTLSSFLEQFEVGTTSQVDQESTEQETTEQTQEATPLPTKADGSVDQTALWNNDPARWAEWNDERRQDGGVNSLNYINGAIAREAAALTQLQAAHNAEADFDKKDAMEAEISKKFERLQALQRLAQSYTAPVQQQAEAEKEEKRRAELRDRAAQWERATGVKINVLENVEDIEDEDVLNEIRRGKKVKGWARNGQAYIFLPNTTSARDVDKTYIHEVVSHIGLKALLGKEEFNKFLDRVWEMMPEEDRQKFLRYPGVNGDTRAAADEYVAHLAEKMRASDVVNQREKSLWEKIVDLVKDAIRKIGLDVSITEDEISDLIRDSYANLKQVGSTEMEQGQRYSIEEKSAARMALDIFAEDMTMEEMKTGVANEVKVTKERYEQLLNNPPKIQEGESLNDFKARKHEYNEDLKAAKAEYDFRIEMQSELDSMNSVNEDGTISGYIYGTEGAVLAEEVNQNNLVRKQGITGIDYAFTANNFYVFENENLPDYAYGNGEINAIFGIAIAGNEDAIEVIKNEIEYGIIEDSETLDSAIEEIRNAQAESIRNNTSSTQERGSNERNDSLLGGQPAFRIADNSESSRDIQDSSEGTEVISEEQLNAPNSGTAQQITAADGEVLADTDGKGGVRFSIRTWEEGGRDYLAAWLANDQVLAEDEKADILARMDEFYKNALLYSDTYAPFGTWSDAEVRYDNEGNPLMSVVKANGDYAMNLDFSLVCKKRRPLNRLLRTLINRNAFGSYDLKEREIAEINWILQEHGFEVACALCFVDSKRYRVAGVADVFAKLWNNLVTSLAPKGVQIAHFNYNGNPNVEPVENGLDTLPDDQLNWKKLDKAIANFKKGSVEYKVAQYLREHPEARKLVDATDFIEAEGFEAVKEANPDLLKFYNMKKGTGGPKASFGDVQHLNDILKSGKKFDAEKAYAVGGVRLQSFSDFVPHMYFDYMQLFAELAAKKLPVHAYTKETLFAKIFGLTGAKINLSLVPAVVEGGVAPGLDAEGNYAWADPVVDAEGNVIQQGQTFPYGEAMDIQRAEGYSKNCGAIAVGISDAHIEKMLDDPNIPFIIPYHKSSLNAIVARMTNIDQYKDYTNVQNTRKASGSKLDKSIKDFNFNEYLHGLGESGTPQMAAQAYLDWCRENKFIPKFSQFAYHPNYYKLLQDFNTIDLTTGEYAPQGAVTMTFPSEQNAFGNVETLIQQGLQEDAALEEKMEQEIDGIADQVVARLEEIAKEPKMSDKQRAKKMAELADERMAKIKEQSRVIDLVEEAKKAVAREDAKGNVSFRITPEMKEIKEKTQADGTFMKAPNGQPTNLSEEQWLMVRTENFKKWFGDWENDPENASKVVDENGEPKVVFHQTNQNIYVNRETGENWDELGWKEKMEWDERDDWEDYWEEQDFNTFSRVNARTTNEFDGFFFAPEYDEYHEYGDRTIAAFVDIKNPASREDYNIDSRYNDAGRNERIRLQEAGFDGVIRMDGDNVDEYIAFEPNQIKSATDNNGDFNPNNNDIRFRITPEQDKAYMDAVNAGDMETAQRMVIEAAKLAMPNTKVVDENGNPMVVYHGSTAMFTVFDKSRIGSATGTADGRGFYFTTDRDYALGYKTSDGQLFEVFLNIDKPLSYDKKTITKAQLRKILKEADRVEYEQEGEHYMLSNYANYNDVGIDSAVNEAANLEYDYADNDVELVGSLIGGSGSFDLIMDAVKKVTGKSGMIAPKGNGTIHYVVTDPAGIKSAEPVTYDNDGNVIPLSERFNPEKEDIRFRMREEGESAMDFHQSALDDFGTEFNIPAPTTMVDVNDRDAVAVALGYTPEEFTDEQYQYILDGYEMGGSGIFDPETKKIAIFVKESKQKTSQVYNDIFHENTHYLVDKHPELLELGEWLWNNPEPKLRRMVKEKILAAGKMYEGEEFNEMLSGYTGLIMSLGKADVAFEKTPSELKKHWELIFNAFGYGPERNDKIRRRGAGDNTGGVGSIRYRSNVGEQKHNNASQEALSAEERRIIGEYFPEFNKTEEVRFRTSLELNEEFGDAWRNQQNEDGRHSTQVANTKSTYEKIGHYLEDAGMKGASILDASSGLGLGTQALREMGFQVDDVEPFPSENREAPTFSSYADIDGKYDVVISNAVLNVIPDDWRADVLHQMADAVKEGGKMIINTRPASNIAQQGVEGKTRITLDSPSEILVKRGDRIAAYQKGFTSEELAEWIKSELGEGWRVEKATKKNSGISGEGTAVVIKDGDNVSFRTTGTPTDEVVANGLNLTPSQTSEMAANIFAALPEESRKKITEGLNGNILGLKDAILQIPASLASKENWNDEDRVMADIVAEEMTKMAGEMTRPFSAPEALWLLYNNLNKSTDLVSEASRALIKRNLGLAEGQYASDSVRFRTANPIDGIDEIVNTGKQKMSEDNKASRDELLTKLAAINADLSKVRSITAAQKAYDAATVKMIADLANELLNQGALSDLTRYEIMRLLSVIKGGVGKKNLSVSVERLVNLMISNQLRLGKNRFVELSKIRGSKVDSKGIEVRGRLDANGQVVMNALRTGLALDLARLEERISETEELLSSPSETVQRNAENELVGYKLARRYLEEIKESEIEEGLLRQEIEDAEKSAIAGTLTNEQLKEFKKATYTAIQENRMQRVQAYSDLIADLTKIVKVGVERAGLLKEAEKARVEKIQHYANSDLQGKDASAHTQKKEDGIFGKIVKFFASPLATFEQWMRVFGEKSADGKGYLYNHFVGGWNKANNEEYLGVKAAHEALDKKVREVFGKKIKRWSDLFSIDKKLPKATVAMWDDGEMRNFEVTQGNLLYIYMVNKMTDGAMKLRKMGITEADVMYMSQLLDPRFVELADWIQDEFLPGLRDKYNEVHIRMFGAPMAAIDNYFPIKVLANARVREVDLGAEAGDAKPSTITGSIIKRTRNSLALDILGSNAFDVVLEHIEQMEHWAAFAEFNRDLNTLLSYRKFRNRVQNMSALGSGTDSWNSFKETAEIVAGVYKPQTSKVDKELTNAVRGLTAGKISFRLWTALKQILAMPAFLPYVNPLRFAKNLATPWNAWNWAMEELPAFVKRWKSREAGNVRLKKTEVDSKFWSTDFMEIATRLGMTPNAAVDAFTCAIGAKSVYDTMYARYKGYGYSHKQADEKAKLDATITFNATQQSSEAAFVSSVQSDRTFIAHAMTVFRNNSFGMGRELVDALRNTRDRMKKGYKEESIEFMTKQMVRDGLTEEQAQRAAERIYRNSAFKDVARIGTFGFLMQFLWNLGNSALYLLAGDDDDEKEQMIKDAAIKGAFGSFEGLGFGNLVPEAASLMIEGNIKNYSPSFTPSGSDLKNLFNEMMNDPVAGASELVNILIQAKIGTNPQIIADTALAIYDACNGDLGTSKEVGIALMRLLQAPQSSIDKLIMDEVDFTAEEGLDMTISEFAKRYASYKNIRNAPYSFWAYSDDAEKQREDKYIKRFLKDAEEKKRTRGTENAKTFYEYYDTEYQEMEKTIGDLRKSIKEANRNGDEETTKQLQEQYKELSKTDEFKEYAEVAPYIKAYDRLKGKTKDAPTPEARRKSEEAMYKRRDEAVEKIRN